MLFPVVIHKDAERSYSVTIPDMPGCFTGGATMQEAIKNIQEAAECHYIDEPELPIASDLEKWIHDPDYANGTWVMVDVDISRLRRKQKTNYPPVARPR
jgi:predicted RNase H-like HicB family nuclease